MTSAAVATWTLLPLVLLATACGSMPSATHPTVAPTARSGDDGRSATADLAHMEVETFSWLSAADPRLAARTGVTASAELLERIGTDAVLGEDSTMHIRGSSLDLFSLRARSRTLAQATRALGALRDDLPSIGPVGGELRRPRLERELLLRLLEEERGRTDDEAKLDEAGGDLIRAMVATWTPPSSPQDVSDRDAWVARHLLEMRETLHAKGPRTGPPGLDAPLYPLEHLLVPQQYPHGAAAIAQLRIALDEDFRVVPKVDSAERIARSVRVHLGLTIDPSTVPAQFAVLETRLRTEAESRLAALDEASRNAALAKARTLLFVEGVCPAVEDSPVRSMPPPPERAPVCGMLHALSDRGTQLAAIVALHDDVQLSLAAVMDTPPPRTTLLSNPANEDVDSLRQMASERPAVALSPAFAAQIAFSRGVTDARIDAWRELGDVPLDIMARELGSP